jgi:hypothetical protein
MHMSGLAMPVSILAMIVSGRRLRAFVVVVAILWLDRFAVLFHHCFKRRSHLVLLLGGWLFLFLYHGLPP